MNTYRIIFVRKAQPHSEAETVCNANTLDEAVRKFKKTFAEKHFIFRRAKLIKSNTNAAL